MQTNAITREARKGRIAVPKAPVLVMEAGAFVCLTVDGEIERLTAAQAALLVRQHMPLVCNAAYLAGRLGLERLAAYDVLELFAFVHPAQSAPPTLRGLSRYMSLLEPETGEDQCMALRAMVRHLLADLTMPTREEKSDPAALAALMGLTGTPQAESLGWVWADFVLAALGRDEAVPTRAEMRAALRVWDKLPEWAVHAPEPPAGHFAPEEAEVRERLQKLLARQHQEDRPQQTDYALTIARAFQPRDDADNTRVVLAEAGTGVGKTLGYLAPATVWAEKNAGTVWVSTYTRNLQRQVESEIAKLYDDPVTLSRKAVTRKGRENYLCLLNLEDIAQSASIETNSLNAVALGLMTRWASVTNDGDLAGKDFPGWLVSVLGRNRVYSFADRRGECIYAACPHFNKCFVEKSIRKAKRADIVIANHALVMNNVSLSGDGDVLPARYIFDEGHHLFEAADSAFELHLNGTETADLRRWILGHETGGRSRARGIKKRLEELVSGDDEAKRDLEDVCEAARSLPGPLWRQRLQEENPKGSAENFFVLCRRQVHARNKESLGGYSLECPLEPPIEGLFEAAYAFALRLRDIQRPMLSLISYLQNKRDDEAAELDSNARERIAFAITSLQRRANAVVAPWIKMLEGWKNGFWQDAVYWLEVSRNEGREDDAGFYCYYLDPVKAFAEKLKPHAHGVAITSATLRDISPHDDEGWATPKLRTGTHVLDAGGNRTTLFSVASPFDYAAHTRVIVIKDVKKEDPRETAAAMRELFLAAGGGALGLFTAVQRLKAVHELLLPSLEKAGIPLYAQHADALDIATLIDMFRDEENACLLGTDATRDGVDVPGRSLRLVVYDRVPWPRPTLLHKARREHFGKGYDDMLTRFKVQQAFGRLVRRKDDKGVFVMLDGAFPTRLTAAFPEGVAVQRVGLKEAVELIKQFINTDISGRS